MPLKEGIHRVGNFFSDRPLMVFRIKKLPYLLAPFWDMVIILEASVYMHYFDSLEKTKVRRKHSNLNIRSHVLKSELQNLYQQLVEIN